MSMLVGCQLNKCGCHFADIQSFEI